MRNTKSILTTFLLLYTFNLFAQEGHIYLTNYEIDEAYTDSRIRSIAFDTYSSVFLASRKGVAVFNGTWWERVQNIPANVLVIATDSTARLIYAGLKDEFGYIFRDSLGLYKYKPIIQLDENTGDFNQIIITDSKIYFYSTKSIFMVNKSNHEEIIKINNPYNDEYSGILVRKDKVYVNVKGKGVCELKEQKLSFLKTGRRFKNDVILFSTTCNNIYILIGTNKNQLYLFNGKNFTPFSERTQIRDFLRENILWNGVDFTEEYFAIATLTGGCVIIDKAYGKIKYQINFMTGLPDDEIFAFSKDKDNALWMAHEHGMSSCHLDLNIRNYTPYPGIYGNINDVLLKNRNLYVASNNGVYILKSKNAKKGQKKSTSRKKAVVKAIKTGSLGSKFEQVINLSDKCKQLYVIHNKILAVSDYGLYEITDSLATPLIKDVYINSLCSDKDTNVLYAASLKGLQLLSYTVDSVKNKTKWQKKNLFPELAKAMYSVVQDADGDLIFGSEGKAYFCKKDSILSYGEPIEIKFPEKINEPLNVRIINQEICFVQSAGILVFDKSELSVNYQNKEEYAQRNFRFISSNDNIWKYKDNSWMSIDPNKEVANKIYWNLFHKIRKVYVDNKKNTWLINGKKQLIKILSESKDNKPPDFRVHITSIYDNADSLYNLNNAVFEYKRNAIKVKLSAPFRLDPKRTQYRFRVEGLANYEKWSTWKQDPVIELSYIPAGIYKLHVNARNIIGQLSNEAQLKFKILKPFWETDIFYFSSGGGFLIFLFLVIFLSRMRLKRKNRILEKKVLERTIELQEEKDKTEELLLNILPKQTAEELKLNNSVKPRNYDLVTVLFTDFKGFTMIAEKLTPAELVHEIDYCFKEFDKIIGKYRIEKIKTIGDAYMCASGLPQEYKNNAVEMVKAAIEIRDFMNKHKEQCQKENKPCFEIRIGMHTGKVVAGVVGIKKYAYDIWGDAVNIAARMESSGESGKINISGETYKLVKKSFKCTHRGKIEAKNKGEIDMYFIEGAK